MGVPVKNLKLVVDNDNPVSESNTVNDEFMPLVGLSLGSFLQALSMDQQTCILEISRDGKKGRFYFIEGSLYDAAYGNLDGQEAALELISWEGIRYSIKKIADASQVPRKITKSLISLLMDSTRQMDEQECPEVDPDDAEEEGERELESAAVAVSRQAGGQLSEVSVEAADREVDMALALEGCLDSLAAEMSDALFRSVIIDFESGEVLAGRGVKLSALDYYAELNRMFSSVTKAHSSAPGRYFLLNVDEARTVIFLNVRNLRWAVDFDSKKMKLGVFLNMMAPKLIEWCEKALGTGK